MELSSYQKLRHKMEKIKRWLIIKQDKFQGKDPVSELMRKYLTELEAIIYEKDNDRAS